MKLRYKNIVIGNLSNLSCDMYREGGRLELLSIQQRETSKLSDQLFKWIKINSRLAELELELDDEVYDESSEVEKLWDQYSELPNFENHDNWNLFDDKLDKIEIISSLCFYPGSVGYSLNPPEVKERKKDFSGIIGFLIGLVLVLIWFFIEYGTHI